MWPLRRPWSHRSEIWSWCKTSCVWKDRCARRSPPSAHRHSPSARGGFLLIVPEEPGGSRGKVQGFTLMPTHWNQNLPQKKIITVITHLFFKDTICFNTLTEGCLFGFYLLLSYAITTDKEIQLNFGQLTFVLNELTVMPQNPLVWFFFISLQSITTNATWNIILYDVKWKKYSFWCCWQRQPETSYLSKHIKAIATFVSRKKMVLDINIL